MSLSFITKVLSHGRINQRAGLPKLTPPPGGATTVARCVGKRRWNSTASGKEDELQNDVQELKDKIDRLQTFMAEKVTAEMETVAFNLFMRLSIGLGGLIFSLYGATFICMQAQSKGVSCRFDAVNSRFDAVNLRFDAQNSRLDAQDYRLNAQDDLIGAHK